MAPVVLASQSFKIFFQERSHADDAVSHTLDFAQPLLVETWIVQDLCSNPSTMHRRIRIEWANKDFDLRIDALFLFCRVADDRESPHSFAIQSLHASMDD